MIQFELTKTQQLFLDTLRCPGITDTGIVDTGIVDTGIRLAACSAEEWQALATLATEHNIAAFFYTRLQQYDVAAAIPSAVQSLLQRAQQQTVLCNLQLYHQLHEIVAALPTPDVPLMLLKGAHLAAAVYTTIEQRAMTDLDLLVHPADIPILVQTLAQLGYAPVQPLQSLETHFAGTLQHLPPFVKPNAPSIEIHWTVTPRDQPYGLPVDALWERAQRLALQTAPADTTHALWGLSPEDLLIHICLHATGHLLRQGVRFLCDIDAIVQHHGPDTTPTAVDYHSGNRSGNRAILNWHIVIERTIAARGERSVGLALVLAQQFLGTTIPPAVHAALLGEQFDAQMQQAIVKILFTEDRELARTLSPTFMRLQLKPHFSARLRYLWNRLFISRQQLALKYAVEQNSPLLYFYYLNRFKDLLSRHVLPGYIVPERHTQRIYPLRDQRKTEQATLLDWLEAPQR